MLHRRKEAYIFLSPNYHNHAGASITYCIINNFTTAKTNLVVQYNIFYKPTSITKARRQQGLTTVLQTISVSHRRLHKWSNKAGQWDLQYSRRTHSVIDVRRLPSGLYEQHDECDSTPQLTRSAKTSSWLRVLSFVHVYVCNLTDKQTKLAGIHVWEVMTLIGTLKCNVKTILYIQFLHYQYGYFVIFFFF